MKKKDILNNFLKIICNNTFKFQENLEICKDLKFRKENNLFTIYRENISYNHMYDICITIDIENYDIDKIKYKNNNISILTFYVADLYVCPEMRNKKNSFYLFYNLCIYLHKLHKNNEIFLKLDDCTGYDYKNNIYSKMGFFVEQNEENKLVNTLDWYRDEYNNNPNENRYGYIPIILKNCSHKLNLIP